MFFIIFYLTMNNYIPPTIEERLLKDFNPQTIALTYHLSGRELPYKVLQENCKAISLAFNDSDNYYKYGGATNSHMYLVADDETCDELWDADLDSYIEECILDELPDHLRFYFDEECWKRDAKFDGRAHSLARYDGNEYCETVDNQEFWIYRQD